MRSYPLNIGKCQTKVFPSINPLHPKPLFESIFIKRPTSIYKTQQSIIKHRLKSRNIRPRKTQVLGQSIRTNNTPRQNLTDDQNPPKMPCRNEPKGFFLAWGTC